MNLPIHSDIAVDHNAMLSPVHGMLSTIRRETDDVTRLNEIVNHESVKGMLLAPEAMDTVLDLSFPLSRPANVFLVGEHGYMAFIAAARHNLTLFDAHTAVLPSGRGAWAELFVRACLHWMFTRTPAAEISTLCPHTSSHPATTRLARAVGAALEFTSERRFPYGDGQYLSADVYTLSVTAWVRTAPGLEERGRWFHTKLDAEYKRLGRKEPNHPDDTGHDRHVGACIEMIFGEHIAKGLAIYARFASLGDYAPIEVTNPDPLLLDIRDAYIMVQPNDFYVYALKERRTGDH